MRPLRPVVTALWLAAACTVMTAPAARAGGGGGGSICDGFATGDDLVMYDSCFAGTAQLVDRGTTTLTVTNDGSMDHTITATDDSFDLYVPAGETATVDLPDADLITVYCTLHGTPTGSGMAGVIVRTADVTGVAPAAAGEAAAGDDLGSTTELAAIDSPSSGGGGDGIAVVAIIVAGVAAALSVAATAVAVGTRRRSPSA